MVQFRVSKDERKAIAARAKAARETVNQYAKRMTLAGFESAKGEKRA